MAKQAVLMKNMSEEDQIKLKTLNEFTGLTFTDLKLIAHTQKLMDKVEEALHDQWEEFKKDAILEREAMNTLIDHIDAAEKVVNELAEDLKPKLVD